MPYDLAIMEDTDRDPVRKRAIHRDNPTQISGDSLRNADPRCDLVPSPDDLRRKSMLKHAPHPDEPVFSRNDVARRDLEDLGRLALALFPEAAHPGKAVARITEGPVVQQSTPVIQEKVRSRWRIDFSFLGSFLKFRIRGEFDGTRESSGS